MTPETFEPFCVKTTSESPNPLPLVHHLPSMFEEAAMVDLVTPFEGLAVDFVGGLAGEVELFVFAEFLFAAPEDLPPPGCARARPPTATINAATRKNNRSLGFI